MLIVDEYWATKNSKWPINENSDYWLVFARHEAQSANIVFFKVLKKVLEFLVTNTVWILIKVLSGSFSYNKI